MFYVFPRPEDIAHYVSIQIGQRFIRNNKVVLGLATSSTMKPVYAQLIEFYRQRPCSLDHVHCFNLDEYIGLKAEHPQSYAAYMQKHLYQHLPFVNDQLYLPCGQHWPTEAQCLEISKKIKSLGGIDLQLLGIGTNGHIGFNEPGTSFHSRTHVVTLSEQTRKDNSRFFTDKNEMPTHAVTLGLKDISEAKEVYLLATGKQKAPIMAQLQQAEITETLPASILKKHPNAFFFVDKDAAEQLDPAQCTDYRFLLERSKSS